MKNELLIDGLSHDLRGVSRLEGKACFIPGALPGETVKVAIKQKKRRFIEAELQSVIKPSVDRVTPACPIYDRCGGCDFQYCSGEKQLAYKQDVLLQQFSRLAKISPETVLEPISSSSWHYRRRARLSCRWNKKTRKLELGFRARNSKDIVPLSGCPVLEEALESLLIPLADLLRGFKDKKSIGHIEIVAADTPAVLIRQLNDWKDEDQLRLENFAKDVKVKLYIQKEGSSPKALVENQDATLCYSLPGESLRFEFQPGDFIQGNSAVNEAMITRALSLLDLSADDQVLDLFCGLGNFTLPIAKCVKSVVAFEGNNKMVETAIHNANINQIDNVSFSVADLFKPAPIGVQKIKSVNKVLLDPPRDGAAELCQQLAEMPLEKILYVSCNPSTLARDAKYLLEKSFVLASAGVVDMFPQTHHIEAMALFERR